MLVQQPGLTVMGRGCAHSACDGERGVPSPPVPSRPGHLNTTGLSCIMHGRHVRQTVTQEEDQQPFAFQRNQFVRWVPIRDCVLPPSISVRPPLPSCCASYTVVAMGCWEQLICAGGPQRRLQVCVCCRTVFCIHFAVQSGYLPL